MRLVTGLVVTIMACLITQQSALGLELPWVSPMKYRLILDVDPRGIARSSSPCSVNVDFPKALSDKGIAGKFDEHTIEVVAYDYSGTPKTFDGSRKGYERYLLPWRLAKHYGIGRATLNFVLPDDACTRYAAYFDTVESALGRPGRYPGLVGDGDLFREEYERREIGAHHFDCFADLDGDIDIITGQGHGGSGIRFYERDFIEDFVNDTHPVVTIENAQISEPSLLAVVRRYADAMIEHGRDAFGEKKTGLFLSALDRRMLKPLTIRPASPGGIRRGDRAGLPWLELVGANPQVDENLLRVLYVLSGISGDQRYKDAANHEVEWFFNNAQSPVTGLLPWGEHLSWHVFLDQAISSGTQFDHEFARPWVLWDESFELAPEASKRFALGLWNHQIANQQTGGFDRHAPYDRHGPADGKDFARHAGFYIHTWAYAYKHTKDEAFLHAIDILLARFERKRQVGQGKAVATIGPLDVETAASMVTEPLASRLREFADTEDQLILLDLRQTHARPDGAWAFEPTWEAGYSAGVTAGWAMFALARYEQVKKDEFRDLVVAVADAYVDSLPAEDVDVWPMSFAHIISAEAAAYRLTKDSVYLEQACRFARMAVDMFWQDSPLPRASLKTDHYETITGADSLALALLEVHAARNNMDITIPSNTIDR